MQWRINAMQMSDHRTRFRILCPLLTLSHDMLAESILLLSLPVVACFIFYCLSPTVDWATMVVWWVTSLPVDCFCSCMLHLLTVALCSFFLIKPTGASLLPSQPRRAVIVWPNRCFDFWVDAVSGVSAGVIVLLLFSPSGYLTHPSFVFIPSHQQTGGYCFAMHWLIKLM